MAKTSLETAKNRLSLSAGKLHTERLSVGSHLLYERPEPAKGREKQSGTFSVRLTNSETGQQKRRPLGTADDYTESDGLLFLSYTLARIKAFEVLKELAKEFEEGITGRKVVSKADYTVKEAIDDYIEHLINNDKKSYNNIRIKLYANVIPYLGDLRVSRLTKDRVDDWKLMLSRKPKKIQYRVKGNKVLSREGEEKYDELSEDDKRKRKGTANNSLELLNMALNHAIEAGKVETPSRGSWKDSDYFKGTRVEKIMVLTPEEQKRLIDSCINEEFRNLVIAGLLTGGRVSELAALTVKDFNKENQTIFYGPFGKVAGKTRHVYLTEEGVAFFSRLCEGKGSNDLILTRHPIKYKKIEKARKNPLQWQSTDHNHCMNLTCREAGINGFTIHGLRHQYISVLVNKGVPLAYIANQAGHSSIKLIEKVYGHLMHTSLRDTIVKAMPNILD